MLITVVSIFVLGLMAGMVIIFLWKRLKLRNATIDFARVIVLNRQAERSLVSKEIENQIITINSSCELDLARIDSTSNFSEISTIIFEVTGKLKYNSNILRSISYGLHPEGAEDLQLNTMIDTYIRLLSYANCRITFEDVSHPDRLFMPNDNKIICFRIALSLITYMRHIQPGIDQVFHLSTTDSKICFRAVSKGEYDKVSFLSEYYKRDIKFLAEALVKTFSVKPTISENEILIELKHT